MQFKAKLKNGGFEEGKFKVILEVNMNLSTVDVLSELAYACGQTVDVVVLLHQQEIYESTPKLGKQLTIETHPQ